MRWGDESEGRNRSRLAARIGVVLMAGVLVAVAGCSNRQSRYEKRPSTPVAPATATPPPEATTTSAVPVGLRGDVLPGNFSPAAPLTDTVGGILSDLAKEAKVAFYPSTLSRERGLLGRRVTVAAGRHAMNGLVNQLCHDAALSCFYTTSYKAIAAYDPAELEPHQEDVVGGPGVAAPAKASARPVSMPVPKKRPKSIPVSFAAEGAPAPQAKAP